VTGSTILKIKRLVFRDPFLINIAVIESRVCTVP